MFDTKELKIVFVRHPAVRDRNPRDSCEIRDRACETLSEGLESLYSPSPSPPNFLPPRNLRHGAEETVRIPDVGREKVSVWPARFIQGWRERGIFFSLLS